MSETRLFFVLLLVSAVSGYPSTTHWPSSLFKSTSYKPYLTRPTFPPGAPKVDNGWRVEEMPNPQFDTRSCGRGDKRSFVCDPTNILSTIEADDLDYEIMKFCRALPRCLCADPSNNKYSRQCTAPSGCSGIKIAVAAVPNIYNFHYQASVSRADVSDWARRLRTSQWSLGSCQDDILIVLSKNDRQIYTSSGALARTVLSDKCVDDYYTEVRNHLTRGEYGYGIKLLISKYREGIAKGQCQTSSGSGGLSTVAIIGIVAGVIAVVAIISAIAKSGRSGWNSGSGSRSYHSTTYYHSSPSYSGGGGSCGGGSSGGGGGGGGGGGSF